MDINTKKFEKEAGEPVKNRLALEKSPYLLQHAENPVDWYPWGEEAFEKARREDKPVFLSIGYSTCHWCHVMERESFEDREVAALMNEAFVSIKVDREERPDIDNIYMTVCQMMTGSGGWPLTIFMTPDAEPFLAATYIPKRSRFGRKGMMDMVPQLRDAWKNRRKELMSSAAEVTGALVVALDGTAGKAPGEEALHLGFRELASHYDKENGGFGTKPKFPTPHQLIFLLRYWHRTGNSGALAMVEKTLLAMRKGGIFDQVGFGFHRYSTDETWLVPHFEKMLYDQALLIYAYSEAYEATGKEEYARTVRETVEYVLRDLTAPSGAFFSAEDADSEGVEGKFYLWSKGEIESLLGNEAEMVIDIYGVTSNGNFHDEGVPDHSNILSLDPGDGAGLDSLQGVTQIDAARGKLLSHREKRIRPLRDDKVLTDWNGLMIAALAKASVALGEPSYAGAAAQAAGFITGNLSGPGGALLHRYRDGDAGLTAHLDDYAFFVFGLLELYEATHEPVHLEKAIQLNQYMTDNFKDTQGGGLFFTAKNSQKLLAKSKEYYDGAIPSGNSIAFFNNLRLAALTGDSLLYEVASEISRGYDKSSRRAASAHAMFLVGLDYALGPSLEVVVSGDESAADTKAMLGVLGTVYAPRKVVLLRSSGNETLLSKLAPFTEDQPALGGKATAYVCLNHSCSFPTNDPAKLNQNLVAGLKNSD